MRHDTRQPGFFSRLRHRLPAWFFRWQPDGTAPIRLHQRRIYILPTRAGLLYAVTLIVMLLGAINYNLSLGHALVFLLAGLGIVGMVHTFRNLYGLEVRGGRCEPVFAGDPARFALLLASDRAAPRPGMVLAAPGNPSVTTTVDRKNGAKITVPVATGQRGWLPLPRLRLQTTYPLGLFVAWAYLQPDLRCLVYPRPLPSPLPPTGVPAPGGTRQSDSGDEDFAGFRTRQPADSLRHVAWKASARLPEPHPLLVGVFTGGTAGERRLDWNATDPALPVETRLSLLTGWVLAAHAAGEAFALHLPDRALPGGRGSDHLQQCLTALALCEAGNAPPTGHRETS